MMGPRKVVNHCNLDKLVLLLLKLFLKHIFHLLEILSYLQQKCTIYNPNPSLQTKSDF